MQTVKHQASPPAPAERRVQPAKAFPTILPGRLHGHISLYLTGYERGVMCQVSHFLHLVFSPGVSIRCNPTAPARLEPGTASTVRAPFDARGASLEQLLDDSALPPGVRANLTSVHVQWLIRHRDLSLRDAMALSGAERGLCEDPVLFALLTHDRCNINDLIELTEEELEMIHDPDVARCLITGYLEFEQIETFRDQHLAHLKNPVVQELIRSGMLSSADFMNLSAREVRSMQEMAPLDTGSG